MVIVRACQYTSFGQMCTHCAELDLRLSFDRAHSNSALTSLANLKSDTHCNVTSLHDNTRWLQYHSVKLKAIESA